MLNVESPPHPGRVRLDLPLLEHSQLLVTGRANRAGLPESGMCLRIVVGLGQKMCIIPHEST